MNELLKQTPSQTVGPYFAYGLTAEQYHYPFTQVATANVIQDETIKGERITITGKVLDGDGNFIADAMIEIWQADGEGNYNNPNFKGFGRVGTGTSGDGKFIFETIKPGSVNGAAPHITVIVFMRGILVHAYTRIYFSDEFELNENDEVIKSVDKERIQTLIAKRNEVNINAAYHFDIYMQGENETVFFDV
jgi:protocatechuate 3,4-dioxygenase, alpha subunit